MNQEATWYERKGKRLGAIKLLGRWVKVDIMEVRQKFPDISKDSCWQGPPSPAIEKAMNCK